MSDPSGPTLLILAFSPLRSDARVLRQIRLLCARYAVTTVGYGPAPQGEGIELVGHHPIPEEIVAWHKDRRLLLLRRYQAAYDTAPVIRHLRRDLATGSWDVVLANDVETVPLALSLDVGAVHADLHEYAPRQNEESWRWRWFVAPFQRWLVRTQVTRADSVTTVGPELAREYAREFGVEAAVVVNAAPYAERSPQPVHAPLRLVHSGLARRNRSLEVMLDAVRQTTRSVTLDLYLMPNDPVYLAELRDRVADLPNIRFHDPVPPEDLGDRLAECDLGVFVLPPLTFNYRFTLPNKIFDFVQARLGVLVGPSPEMAALVREHHLGLVLDDFGTEALTRVLDTLTDERVVAFKAASHAAASQLSAQRQVQGWAEAIDGLATRPRTGTTDPRWS